MKFWTIILGTIFAISAMGYTLQAASSEPDKEIPWGWYERADSRASGSAITAWNMRLGETNTRCMCAGDEGTKEHTGFWVQDQNDGTFIVKVAPKGYSDTPGRRFKWKQSNCLNCAD